MRKQNHIAVLALLLLAPAAYAADESGAVQTREAGNPATQPAPKDSCAKPCTIYRISSRCECSLRGSPPTAAA